MNGFIPHHVKVLEYTIFLSKGRYAMMTFPEDLNDLEASRLGLILAAVAGGYPDTKDVISRIEVTDERSTPS